MLIKLLTKKSAKICKQNFALCLFLLTILLTEIISNFVSKKISRVSNPHFAYNFLFLLTEFISKIVSRSLLTKLLIIFVSKIVSRKTHSAKFCLQIFADFFCKQLCKQFLLILRYSTYTQKVPNYSV